jgi:uncharacterized protein
MLLRFGAENHRSIKSYQEFSLVATRLKDDESSLISASSDAGIKISPMLALYGANASGKSAALSAFLFLVDAVTSSHTSKLPVSRTPFEPFLLDSESREKPSRYDVDFVLAQSRYHYGFSLNGKRIIEEWLYSFPMSGERQSKSVLFHRKEGESNEFYFGKHLKGSNKAIAKLVRPNSLFLSAAAQNAHSQLTPIYQYFDEKITRRMGDDYDDMLPEQIVAYFSEDPERLNRALEYLSAADTGILSVEFEKVPLDQQEISFLGEFEQFLQSVIQDKEFSLPRKTEKAAVKFLHRGKEGKPFPIGLENESTGTKSFLGLIGPALVRLVTGGILVVDELNSNLHPLMARKLLKMFLEPMVNTGHAQLLFTTHDASLLSSGDLRRDQVWFAEKDNVGATHLYSLSELKVRSRDDLGSGYLQGRFGAVPFYNTWGVSRTLTD